MADLSTTYMGLSLKNPIIVASSDLARDARGIQKCADAGAGAVVMKSIFEEQFVVNEDFSSDEYANYPEAMDYLRSGGLMEYAPNALCREIELAKKAVDIPVIASINCQSDSLWPKFAHQLQEAGADGLELNIAHLPLELNVSGGSIDDHHISILKKVKSMVNIPISVKLIPEISSLPHLSSRLSEAGADALVFFNWFLEPDIDIDTKKTKTRKGTSDFFMSLRWVALLAGRIQCDISASGGVGATQDVVKQLLAGASTVQICTHFYRKGLAEISLLLDGLNDWMKKHRYESLQDFRGELSFQKQELSFKNMGEARNYFRAQYIKTYGVK
jgi:dihydroorotate dehydrogenase (fumarate)